MNQPREVLRFALSDCSLSGVYIYAELLLARIELRKLLSLGKESSGGASALAVGVEASAAACIFIMRNLVVASRFVSVELK